MTTVPYPITCPVCGAEPFMRCRTVKTGRVTDTHMKRINNTNRLIE